MKFKQIFLLTALAFGSVIAFTGCTKDDGAIPNRINIEKVPAISVNFETGPSSTIREQIPLVSAGAFQGKFVASQFFPGTAAPTKIDISVRRNTMTTITGVATNSDVRVFKTNITSLPATFSITASELATLFGSPVLTNQAFDFGPDIFVGTVKYEAFPSASLGSGSGPAGMSAVGFGEFVRYYFK